MVGIFSRFSGGRTGHRRAQSALDLREVNPPNAEITDAATVATAHGIEVSAEFKPVERPTEPIDNDQPIRCPLPEPSILNDGRIWKEHMTSNVQRRADLPVMKDGDPLTSEAARTKPRQAQSNRLILPSMSAPEHSLVKLLEECNASYECPRAQSCKAAGGM